MLVVEDDEFVRELEVEVLQRERFNVIEAQSPADAFRILEKESDAPAPGSDELGDFQNGRQPG